MAIQSYHWAGIDKQGKRISGVLKCNDMKDAQLELKRKNVEIISIVPKLSINFSFGRKKIKQSDILLFTRYLSTMLAAGLPILQALDVIARDQTNPTMQSFVNTLRLNTSSGKTLTESFSQYPQYFNNLYCNLIKAGEKSGTLDKILIRIANYLEKSESLKRKVKKAMVYPIGVICVAFAVSLVLLLFVVPQFETIFKSFGANLPYFTRVVIGISNFLRTFWWIAIVAVVGGVWWLRYSLRHSTKLTDLMDKLSLKLIIVGPVLQKSIIARFARTLAITLEAGMPIIESMRSMSGVMGNGLYRKAVLSICDDIASGVQLNVAMSSTNLFPNMTIQMVAIGEVSGSLAMMLAKIADYYEDDVNTIVDNLSSLLEPLIMAVLGVIVGGFVIAMYLPIFKLGSLF